MAVPVYTERFFALDNKPSGWRDLWTVPASGKWILRDLIIANAHSAQQLVRLIYHPGGGSDTIELFYNLMPATSSQHYELRQVFTAGEKLECYGELGRTTWLGTGYHFDPT